jgi:hypothetical protein
MPQLVDQFRHVGGQIAPELYDFAGDRVLKTELCGVQRLPGETSSLKHRAKGFGCAAIGRVSQ